jgi:catechol 2,3-dioxygenase-like lactoylglutathione lyase family enzyme
LNADKKQFRRVLLRKTMNQTGAFSRLLGNVEIELVQDLDSKPRKIFDGRSWGDLGFIHVCFDTLDMDGLKQRCTENGFPFTVDSNNTFDMGEAGGRFTYLEDPDGTLIEFVETHRVPIMKKIGWYLNLKDRKTKKPLPDWMVSTMGWGKVKA